MPPRRRSGSTFTERARRDQLVALTVDLVAEHGYRGTSLQRIADAAEISKAAVLYHFPSKDAVIAAAYEHVIGGLITEVGAAVEAAPDPLAAAETYVDTVLAHLAAHPRHARLVAESLPDDREITEDSPSSPRRWETLTRLISEAAEQGLARDGVDPRTSAIMLNGVVDGVVAAALEDPSIDIGGSRAAVADLVRRHLRP
ncbi:TetR/AcrR family transcriptional regulator [Pseudonocardia endophytica]|uniref:TetR family transcriptional regulator n=1 Tax=Pseudonocardia endophytica TaxID=401976 RepID=A0A4R1HXJ3_PSEEN|nr:TetR/AcrR family transcriptional regulator [Pseudonocardia endophytica]TCK26201.1 TetR family transcriptional regulator [Pseudonocardia endophytica]